MTTIEQMREVLYTVANFYSGLEFKLDGSDYSGVDTALAQLVEIVGGGPRLEDDIVLRKDGNQWMCVSGDFVNLQESKSWWGDTPAEALAEYSKKGHRL